MSVQTFEKFIEFAKCSIMIGDDRASVILLHINRRIVEVFSIDFDFVTVMFGRMRSLLVTDHLSVFDSAIGGDGVSLWYEGERRADRCGTGTVDQTGRLSERVNEEIQRRPSRIETVDDQFGEMRDAFRIVRRRRQAIVDESNGFGVQIGDIRRTQMRKQKQK